MRKFNMIVVLCLTALLATTFSSCVSRGSADKLQNEKDSLQVAVLSKDSLMNEVFVAINAISQNLNDIKSRENLLVPVNGEQVKRPVDQINDDISAIDRLLQDNKARIAALEQSTVKLRKANVRIKSLEQMIVNLNTQIGNKDVEISQLKDQLSQLGIKVESLSQQVAGLAGEKSTLEANVHSTTDKLHVVYYLIGTQKELIDGGVINKKGFIGRTLKMNENYDFGKFTKADSRVLEELPLGFKKVTLVSSHPADSYKLIPDGEKGVKSLVITDPDKFWEASKVLVISHK